MPSLSIEMDLYHHPHPRSIPDIESDPTANFRNFYTVLSIDHVTKMGETFRSSSCGAFHEMSLYCMHLKDSAR